MIGEYSGTVKNKVVTALLQAYLDTMDYDGMKSILNEAGLLHLKDIRNINPEDTIDFFSFKKIITAQNFLLYKSTKLLFNLGMKFSFYLFPYGVEFPEIVAQLNHLIDTSWKVQIIREVNNEYLISVKNCVFCSEVGVPCDFFRGFLVHSLEKTLTARKKVIFQGKKEDIMDPDHNNFVIRLIIIDRNK